MSSSGKWIRTSVFLLLIALVIVLVVVFFHSSSDTKSVTVSTILADIKTDMNRSQKDTLTVSSDHITLMRGKDTSAPQEVANINDSFDATKVLKDNGIDYTSPLLVLQYEAPSALGAWVNVLLSFIPFLLIGGLLIFMMRQAQGSNNQALSFGKSRARMFMGNKPSVTFADVAGVEEAKQELEEIVEFLKYPEKFVALGARIPKGLLLVGPPGTGKTLISRAVAGEAGVPFFSISGSEFVEMFVGVGASRVRDLFDQAKRNSPCIVFVDEIDAVGRQRGAGLGCSHDEREQTLNQILVEMDGFDTNTHVIVIAATNRPDVLDPALLRPGRFDRHVTLDRPDIKGRRQILDVHARNKPLDSTVDLDVLARQTPGFSGADLANLINEAAILAARANQKVIGMNELEEAIARVIAGPERKSRRISDKEKEVIAYHETGHALVMKALPHTDPVHKVSIISRGMALGWTLSLPEEDKYLVSRDELYDQIAGIMGGRVAEEIVFNDITSGAENDIQRATQLARRTLTQWGMSDKLGTETLANKEELVFLGRDLGEQRNYSEEIAAVIDEEIRSIINHGYQTARTILTQQRGKMDAVVERLKIVETIDGKELDEILASEEPSAPAAAAGSSGAAS